MISIYHDIVGRGMTMELDVAVDRTGRIPQSHVEVYHQLGNWAARSGEGGSGRSTHVQGCERLVLEHSGQFEFT